MSAVIVENGPDKGAIWHFGDVAREAKALDAGKAWADLSHRAVIRVAGVERLSWLHALTTQHLEKLEPGLWQEALILDPQGRIEQQLFLVDDGEATYIHLEVERKDSLLEYLRKMIFRTKVDVEDVSTSFSILRAPGKSDQIGGPFALLPRNELEETKRAFNAVASEVGIWVLEAERVAHGRPRIGFETDNKSIPNELGLLNIAVHMNKGCYRGQETVAKVFNLGHPPRRLVLLHLDGSRVDLPKTGEKITLDQKEVGFVGTVARHFELGPIALAVIKRMTPVDAILDLGGLKATQEILVPLE
ncbi:MAG: folate-binding protein YgfZ [Actinobacteria bacterium]|nr:folate-binding protein YgfZ [Actinomycetota bacterium]